MNLQSQSNIYLVIIPRNYTNDIHICGRCRVQFTSLSLFIKHKEVCKDNNSKESELDNLNKSMENDTLIEIGSLEAFNETLEKDSPQINSINSPIIKEPNQLKQPKLDILDSHELCVGPKESFKISQHKTQPFLDNKRTLQNDEEDIATLLANQLNSETSIGNEDISAEVNVQSFETFPEDQQEKDKNENDENKIMYRGKMRKLFSCDVEGCMYKTLLRKDIERHSRVHTGERPFKCFLCGKAFNRSDKLLLHQRIHAGDKRYKCTKCDYASVDSGSLIKHLRVHNGERPFKCQLCSYRARDSSQLTVHLRTHTGDSPFICTNVKCKAAFKTNSDLKRHMVVHSAEKPHSCSYCPYKSTLKRNLQIHLQSQHPNGEMKEFKCHLCPRHISSTSRKLKNHLKKDHGISEKKPTPRKTTTENFISEEGENLVETQENFKKRKRKLRKSNDKIAIGVMNKAYDCKLCDASFVCQDSLVTHQRYHSKIEDELKKSEMIRQNPDALEVGKYRKVQDEIDKKVDVYEGDSGLGEGCIMDNSFNDSLRNAEILASLNSSQGIGNIRQYVMIAPEALPNIYNSDEFVLVQN